MRTPLIRAEAHPEVRGDFWPVTGVVPWHCWAPVNVIDPSTKKVANGFQCSRLRDQHGNVLVPVLARHWNIFTPLELPVPPPPRIPQILKAPSAQTLTLSQVQSVLAHANVSLERAKDKRKAAKAALACASSLTAGGGSGSTTGKGSQATTTKTSDHLQVARQAARRRRQQGHSESSDDESSSDSSQSESSDED